MTKFIKYIIKSAIFWLILFAFFRLIFILYNISYSDDASNTVLAKSFLVGLHLDISMSRILYIYYPRELNGEIIDATKEFYLENTSPFETLLTQYIKEHDFEGIVDELRQEVVGLRKENESQKETLDTLSLNIAELEARNNTLQEENAAKDSRIKELEDRLQELENTDAGEI